LSSTIAAGTTWQAWQGWVRPGAGHPFTLPETEPANTRTTVARAGDLVCLFMGYLFNQGDLARELEPAGTSEAEVALAGYRRWGTGVLGRLEGSFTVAVWDQAAESLLCARDPMGMHPLFYWQSGEELVFSWDVETVRRHPGVPRDLNRVVLAEHLMHRWIDREETHFAGVRRLPAAHGLKFRRGRLEVFRYWDPLTPGKPVQWVGREELAEFPQLLRTSVERAMQYGQTGILLSGGFDSVSIAAWASRIARERGWPAPRAYSLIFEGKDSEEAVQRQVAAALGFPHTLEPIQKYMDGRGILGRLIDQSANYPSPPVHIFAGAYLGLIRRAQADGCRVILDGEGGDEWLTVTPALAADLIRSGRWGELGRLAGTIMRSWGHSPLAVLRNLLWTWGLRVLARDWMWRYAPGLARRRRMQNEPGALPAWLAPDPALRHELAERLELWNVSTCRDSHYLEAMRESLTHPMLSMCSEETFCRDVLAGVTTFHPYLDRPMVEFLLRTPPELLNQGGRSKALVRQTLAAQFPELGFDRQKKKLVLNWNRDLCRREGPVLWQELGRANSLERLGLVELEGYHAMLDASLRSDRLHDVHRLWHGANLEAWTRSHA